MLCFFLQLRAQGKLKLDVFERLEDAMDAHQRLQADQQEQCRNMLRVPPLAPPSMQASKQYRTVHFCFRRE